MAKPKSKAEPAPETTGEQRVKAAQGRPPVEYQFKPGNPGRPKGSRNKLGEAFVQALQESFEKHGPETIEKVRVEKPDQYLKVIASLLPKQLEIKEGAFDGLGDDELAALVAAARSALGAVEGGRDGSETTH